MDLAFIDPKQASGRFKAGVVNYSGRRYRVALMMVEGVQVQLGLADTQRCAADLGAAESTVLGIAAQRKLIVSPNEVANAGAALHGHCRQITGWKPREPRR